VSLHLSIQVAPTGAPGEKTMTLEPMLRLIAGTFVTLSVLLGMFVHPAFLWFTVFVGLNLVQSAFTRWCPMMTILRKAGVPETSGPRHAQRTAA
jgi:hypothetical protein